MGSIPIFGIEDSATPSDTKKNSSIGIIGGLGPETTSEFYLGLVRRVRDSCDFSPSVLIDNVSFPISLERRIVLESRDEKGMLPVLVRSARRLNDAGCDVIMMPCNTLHVFIDEIRSASHAPVLSIIEETANHVKSRGHAKVGLLATTKTVESRMHERALRSRGIELMVPPSKDQERVSKVVSNILDRKVSETDKADLKAIADEMIRNGSQAIILGCTDLQLLIKEGDLKVEAIDTMKVLMNSAFRAITDSAFKLYKNKTKECHLLGE
jgi:aspartate racemase